MFNVYEIRKDFPILKTKTNSGNDLIYFDNSATTLKPKVVIDAVSNYYEKMTANVHRGDYDLSHNVDIEYELTRKVVASYINAKKEYKKIYKRYFHCIRNYIYIIFTNCKINIVLY